MNTRRITIIFFIIAVFATSCKTSFNIKVLEPAMMTLPENIDRIASEECANGLYDVMKTSPRFQIALVTRKFYGTGTGVMPPPMGWDELAPVAKESGADAVISLEAFDSNTGLTYANFTQKEKDKSGKETEVNKTRATARMDIPQAWRVYHAKIAGRACYNMAVACEVEGKLNLALDWAKKAYTQFNLSDGRAYSNILQNRLDKEERVRQQMKQTEPTK